MAKDVAKTEKDQLPASLLADMEGDSEEHQQQFNPDQLIIPRLTILQDLSPQVKKTKAEYVEGAEPGLIFNNVTNTLDKEIKFYPSKFDVQYIAWQENRGGLVDSTLTKEEVEANFEENGIGQWTGLITPRGKKDPVRVDVIETPTWVGIASGDGWGPMPVAMAFPVTKAKSARKINTAIDLTEVQGKKGPFKPPAFYHAFTLSTVVESSGDQDWHGWQVSHNGLNDDSHIIHKAKDLKVAFDKGDAEVAQEGAEKS